MWEKNSRNFLSERRFIQAYGVYKHAMIPTNPDL